MTEICKTWAGDMYVVEIDQIRGTIDNEQLWENSDEKPNIHTQNLIYLQEYLNWLEGALKTLKEE